MNRGWRPPVAVQVGALSRPAASTAVPDAVHRGFARQTDGMSYLDADAVLIRSCLPEGTGAPEDSEDLFVLYAVLMRAKGEDTQAADVHDAWSAWMSRRAPDHESICPYDQLTPSVQAEDVPFITAIHSAARTRIRGVAPTG